MDYSRNILSIDKPRSRKRVSGYVSLATRYRTDSVFSDTHGLYTHGDLLAMAFAKI